MKYTSHKGHLKSKIIDEANENIEDILYTIGIEEYYNNNGDIRCACPVHDGDNDSAFSYNTHYKIWKCFSHGCHEEGQTIIDLVRLVLNYNYIDTINWLCSYLNIDESVDVTNDSVDINKVISQNRIKSKFNSKDDIKDQTNIKPVDVNVIKANYEVSKYFLKQGFTQETLEKFLVFDCHNKNKPMHYRACAPVLSDDGKCLIGVTGRTLLTECHICGKYHNTNLPCPSNKTNTQSYPKWQHYGFKSGRVLYNLWNANHYIYNTNVVILVEGPKDVWWLYQNGIYNVVGIFGLNISEYHITKLIKHGVVDIILGFDNDIAGQEKKEKVKTQLQNWFNIDDKIFSNILPKNTDIAELDSKTINEELKPKLDIYE